MTVPLAPQRSASRRAQRALARAAGDRRVLAGAVATAGAALAAGVAKELIERDQGEEDAPERAYRIRRDEKAAAAVRRIARGRLDDALEHLRERLDEDVAASVHEARKDLKKTRAVLRLVRDRIGEETYQLENARLRDAGRALSGSRDVEAKLETLEALAERYGDELPGLAEDLAGNLTEERDRLVTDRDGDGSSLRAAAREAAEAIAAEREAVDEWSFSKSGWKLMEPGLERSYRRGLKRFSDVRGEPTAENIHEWRKRVKDLWYDLRLLRDSWPDVLGEAADQAHELSDLLGDHHDLTVLAEDVRARSGSEEDSDEASAMAGLIEARQEELLEAAVPVGERLYAEPPKAFVVRLRAYWRAWRPG